MRLPWRSRPLHEQLMQEAGLEAAESAQEASEDEQGWADGPGWGFDAPPAPPSPPDVLGQPLGPPAAAAHGIPRPRGDWDTVVTVEAPGLEGDEIDFLSLEGGDVFVEQALPRGDVSPLADAVESRLAAPYRAHAVRHEGDLWAVSARRIRVESFRARGNDIELSVHDGQQTLRVDGRDVMGDAPELEALGSAAGKDFHARAVRVEGDLWEVEVNPL